MKNKIVIICALVLVAILALFAFSACNTQEGSVHQELVQNGDFQKFSDGKFEGWTTSSSSVSFSRQTTQGDSANQYLCIDNSTKNDYVYLKQTLSVVTNKIYKVSLKIKTSIATSATNGAHVAFIENEEYIFAGTKSTANEWQTYTFYVRPKNTDYMTIALCIGSPNSTSTGKVCFDDVSMQMVSESEVPSDATITNFRKNKTVNTNQNEQGTALVVVTCLLSICILICAYILIKRLFASKKTFVNFDGTSVGDSFEKTQKSTNVLKNTIFIGGTVTLMAFLVRLVMMLTLNGYGGLMASTVNYAKLLGEAGGVQGFVASKGSVLTPGSMYILAIFGAMGKELDSIALGTLIRFVNVLADMVIVSLIYFYGKRYVGNRTSLIFAALYAILPYVFVISGLSNSFESVLVALMLGSLILLTSKKYLPSYLLITLATVLDVRALAIAPIMLAYLAYMYYKDAPSMKKFTANRAMIIFGLVGCFVLAYLLTLPMSIDQIKAGDAFFNFKFMARQITDVDYYVNNALNLYGMVSMNGKAMTNMVEILNLVFTIVLEVYVVSLYFKNRNRQELILLAAFTLAVLAVFTLKVDYTYLFLSIALMIVYTMVSLDKRMYFVTGGYAVLGGVSLTQMLNNSGLISHKSTGSLMQFETTDAFYITFSVLAVLLTGYFVYVVYSITTNTKIVDIKPMHDSVGNSIKCFFKNAKSTLSSIGKKSTEE